jgi:uncharacterized protein YgfB (UPF0149 family)
MTQELQLLFNHSPTLASESMLHGSLCALLCHPLEMENNHWLEQIQSMTDGLSKKEQKALIEYAKKIDQQLQNNDLALKMPNSFESEDTIEKIQSIAQWIDGYTYCYAISNAIQAAAKNAEIEEWINILQKTQRQLHRYLGSTDEKREKQLNIEQFDLDLMEVTEFMRTCIYLCREIWSYEKNKPIH